MTILVRYRSIVKHIYEGVVGAVSFYIVLWTGYFAIKIITFFGLGTPKDPLMFAAPVTPLHCTVENLIFTSNQNEGFLSSFSVCIWPIVIDKKKFQWRIP